MCRLAVFSGITDALELGYALVELELSQGGDGNGLYCVETDKLWKGTNFSVTDFAREASDGKTYLFHTRLCSAGSICNSLCHPFRVNGEKGEYVLAHNGHWMGWEQYSLDKEDSDTECIARMVGQYGPAVLATDALDFSGVFIVVNVKTKQVYYIKRSGTFEMCRLEPMKRAKFSYFHASEQVYAMSWNARKNAKNIRLPADKFFEFMPNGKARWADHLYDGIEEPKPERERKVYYSSDAWMGGGSNWSKNPVTGRWGKATETNWRSYYERDEVVNPEGSEDAGKELDPTDTRYGVWCMNPYATENEPAWECFCTKDGNCEGCAKFYEARPGDEPLIIWDPEKDERSWEGFRICQGCDLGTVCEPCDHCGFSENPKPVALLTAGLSEEEMASASALFKDPETGHEVH